MSAHTKEAASLGPAAENINQFRDYLKPDAVSRAELVKQAAEVLLVLLISPWSTMTTMGLTSLFERRLRRAYEGVTL